jgi:hypothetical protein
MKNRNYEWLFSIFVIIVTAFGGCAINRRVVVGVSADIERRYGMYPSIELDVAAVTDDESDQIKTAGVDGYFSPDSSLRKRLEPFTAYFDDENVMPYTLHIKGNYWSNWQKKKPSKLAIIADLPHSPDMPKDDPRLIFIDIKETFFTLSPIYIEVEPDKVVRVYKKPKDPQSVSKSSVNVKNNAK